LIGFFALKKDIKNVRHIMLIGQFSQRADFEVEKEGIASQNPYNKKIRTDVIDI
jgi:hypothetical protein